MLQSSTNPSEKTAFFAAARTHMIESQLRPNKITDDNLLAAITAMPREVFVPDDKRAFAYIDEDIDIGFGRTLLAPLTIATMLQALQIQPADRVLDIGAGTGYAAALLNDIAGEVIALESDPALTRAIQQNRQTFSLENMNAVQGALCDGFANHSPYQVILIEGAVQWVPEKIIHQLAEGGRLACIVYPPGETFGRQGEIRIYTKTATSITETVIADAAAPLLPGFNLRPQFEL